MKPIASRRILLLLLCTAFVARGEILLGPYVLIEKADELRIRFEVEQPGYRVTLIHRNGERTDVVPDYRRGPRDTFLADVVVSLTPEHPFRGYEIGRSGEAASTYAWRSRIDGTLRGRPRLLAFGDSQGGGETLRRLGQQWRDEEFDLIVGLGDLTDAGSRKESWGEEFFEPLSSVLPHHPFLPVCGNHDSYREKSLEWYDWYLGRGDGRRFARIDFDDLRMIVLNNSDVHTKYGFDPIDPMTPQYVFLLESALGATAEGKEIAVFCHVPIVSASTVVNREFGSVLQRKYVMPILERARMAGIFTGHHHKYERVTLAGVHGPIPHIVTGGGGGRLFTAAREQGGFAMEREVFERYHYLTVDFEGEREVVARALGGEEIDRFSLQAPGAPRRAEGGAPMRFWRATIDKTLESTPTTHLGNAIEFAGAAMEPTETTAEVMQTERGLVGVLRGLGSSEADAFSLQGYDWPRMAWSYLQGGSLVLPVHEPYGAITVIAINGADMSPLDAALPVLHWPLAGARSGVVREAGALMLLRGRRDFEFDPDSQRLIEKWRWGARDPKSISAAQRARQWRVMESPPRARQPRETSFSMLVESILQEGRPEAFVLRNGERATLAVLVHWPSWRILAVVAGESLANDPAPIFVSTATPIQISGEIVGGVPSLRLTGAAAVPLHIPLTPATAGSKRR